ncbi:MAG: heat-inducible transcriptional repressor HrcA [Chloroflexaceae bacterium]|nr:heat-inducible transcriptional repressor HrcA [Chloroflexaceae bacterium]
MAPKLKLSDRQQHVLWATIRHYIATAEPVGSKTLVQEYGLSVSSATIRNILGHLERTGLLYQPHTSAGRIPSDSGYRLYVDELIAPNQQVGKQVEQTLGQELRWDWSFEALVQRAAQILAALSGYIALIALPQTANNRLRHLQLVAVASGQVMVIVVSDGYQTQSMLLNSAIATEDPEQVEGELQILSNFLSSKLRGRSLSELATLDWGELDREFARYADFLKGLLQELSQRSQFTSTTPIVIRGVSEVLRQPEFSQLEQVQMLLHLLEEEQDQLCPLILGSSPEQPAKRVRIRIGSENPLEPMRSCALVSCVYRQGEIPVGSVGMIGPTRMLYENAIALVESAADYLSEALSS